MPADGNSAEHYVEVYDEPLHRVQWSNDYALVYTVNIPRGALTLWHRHCQDTVYCAIGDVAVAETLPGQTPVTRHSTCGAAISRAHRAEPLIHQIRNVGSDVVRFVAAEARARPPQVQTAPLHAAGHGLDWEGERFRVYQVELEAAGVEVEYGFHGLLVALQPLQVEIDGAAVAEQLADGGWRWLNPATRCRYTTPARGIVIEWR
jgi:hypothetical protein